MKITNDTLNISIDTVRFIISKAKEIQAKEGVTFPEPMADSEYEYDWAQVLADHADDHTLQEIEGIITELDEDQQIDLLTLMYIGRGDYDLEEWRDAYTEARHNLAPNLTGYLISKPQIADYLERALDLLEENTEDEDEG